MRFLPTKYHALGDYASAAALYALPFAFGFGDVAAATALCLLAGTGVLILTLMTNFEGGVLRAVPVPVHLTIDAALGAGLLLAAAGFGAAYGFDDAAHIWAPLAAVGAAEIVAALVTEKTSPVPNVDTEPGTGPG